MTTIAQELPTRTVTELLWLDLTRKCQLACHRRRADHAPDFPALVDRALNNGLNVEVYSNLVHVSAVCWELFEPEGLSLARSYYSEAARITTR